MENDHYSKKKLTKFYLKQGQKFSIRIFISQGFKCYHSEKILNRWDFEQKTCSRKSWGLNIKVTFKVKLIKKVKF